MDPQVYLRARIAANRPEMAWRPGMNSASFRTWQNRLRKRLLQTIGGFSEPRVPLNAAIHETREFPRYRRETVRFESRPGLEVFGYFLVPKGAPPRQPAVLCLPGHGTGVDSVVGIGPNGTQRDLGENGEYQADFALQCVARGYPTFAIEQLSFGRRRDAKANRAGGGSSSCTRDSMALLMLGESMIGWRAWDASRAIDYMITRLEVDPKRVVTMGISGGGLTSLFTAAADPRVHTAVVSGYLNTFAGSVLAVDHCPDNYAVGLLRLAEMPDIAGLIAPRGLFCESGAKDDIFPLPHFQQAVERLKAIYEERGARDSFGFEVFEGDHHFHGTGAFAFLERMCRAAAAG